MLWWRRWWVLLCRLYPRADALTDTCAPTVLVSTRPALLVRATSGVRPIPTLCLKESVHD